MKILLAHNFYQQPGGEDQVFADEGRLLESRGHEVLRYTMHNNDIKDAGRLRLAAQTIWNRGVYRVLHDLVAKEKPSVVHFHNTFPQISPAAYYAVRAAGAAVVQGVPNYRLMCPAAVFMREGKVCEECLGKIFAWPGVKHGCYRSRSVTAVTAGMLTAHKLLGTWSNAVDGYVALTEFVRAKLIEGGFPPEKIYVKGNFVDPDPKTGDGSGGYAIFVGRLSPEKGIRTLLHAWELVGNALPLRIVGDGPEADEVRKCADKNSSIQWLGRQPMKEVLNLVGRASILVFPSQWYEGQPKVLLESFAKGTPVLASRLGSMTELVGDDNGRLFTAGDANDLAASVSALLSDPASLAQKRLGARTRFENAFTADQNYEGLINVYRNAIANRAGEPTEPAVSVSKQVTN